MKILLSYTYLFELLFAELKVQKQKEKYLTDSIKKNHRFFISALTLHEIYNQCTFETMEELSIQFDILTEEVLPFTEIVSKLEKSYRRSESNLSLEKATASVYGLDKILTSDGLVSIIGI